MVSYEVPKQPLGFFARARESMKLAALAYSYTTTVLTVTGTALAGKIDYDCDGV